MLQVLVLVMGLGAVLRPAARAPLALLGLLGIGGLFAYFGQIYQTGADAWQLFAARPCCNTARTHDSIAAGAAQAVPPPAASV